MCVFVSVCLSASLIYGPIVLPNLLSTHVPEKIRLPPLSPMPRLTSKLLSKSLLWSMTHVGKFCAGGPRANVSSSCHMRNSYFPLDFQHSLLVTWKGKENCCSWSCGQPSGASESLGLVSSLLSSQWQSHSIWWYDDKGFKRKKKKSTSRCISLLQETTPPI